MAINPYNVSGSTTSLTNVAASVMTKSFMATFQISRYGKDMNIPAIFDKSFKSFAQVVQVVRVQKTTLRISLKKTVQKVHTRPRPFRATKDE